METRLVELETKIAFQEDTLQALNNVVIRQQRQLDRLGSELAAIKEQLRSLAVSPPVDPANEPPPPHY